MKIALFHDFLVRMGGAEHVLATFKEILPNADVHTVFIDREKTARKYPEIAKEAIPHKGAQRKYDFLSYIPGLGKMTTKLFISKMPEYIGDINLDDYDLIVASSTAWSHGLVPPSKAKFVCYMHAPMRFAWDWYNEYKFSLGARKASDWKNLLLTKMLSKVRMWDQLALKKESLLIANSEIVRRRIFKYYHRDALVLHPPVDVEHIPAPTSKKREHEDYFLMISTLSTYKKVDLVINTFNKIGRKLIIIGDGPDKALLKARAGKHITFAGFVSEDEKIEYLRNARGVIYPSEEDFGIVPLEAMAAGVPTIAYGKGGVTEYFEPGKTGEMFAEHTVKSLEKALTTFFKHESSYSPVYMRTLSEKFSKKEFIRSFKKILKEELNISI